MSMQEKGRKHRTDGQNFYESGRETHAPACGHGRRHPYTNVVPWKGAHRAAQTVGFRNRFGRGPPKGTGRRGIFLAVLLGVIGACGRCLSLELSGEPSACGIFRAAGQYREEWRAPSHAPGMVRHVCPGAVARLDGGHAWFSFLSRPKGFSGRGCGNFRFAGAFRMDDFKDCLAIML